MINGLWKKCLAVVCLCLNTAFASSAFAGAGDAKLAFCNNYADKAVSQQRQNLLGHCGREGLKWHDWWEVHQLWCMIMPPERALSALHERDMELRDCRVI